VTGRGILAGYSWRFWSLVVVLGVATGLAAAALMFILRLTERLAYGFHAPSFAAAVDAASDLRRIGVVLLAGVLVAIGAVVFGRRPGAGAVEVSEALWLRAGRLPVLPSLARGVLSVVTVGLGSSLGREAAPQLAGASFASRLSDWAQLPVWQRRLLVACGAGAGFAAVYNVPLGGALFALEVLLGTLALPLVLPALAVSVTATAVAWIFLGTAHTYHMASFGLQAGQMVWALVCGPVIGLVAVAWVRLIGTANRLRPAGRTRVVAPIVVFGLLGVLAIPYPELLGNGKGIVQGALVGGISLGLFAVLLILKPLTTAACLGSGAPGGLFTPTLSIGVLLAGVLAGVWSHLWPHTMTPAYALIGGGAFLAASMQGPLSGVVIVLELTSHFDTLMAPALLVVVEATIVARRFGAQSIYSARLRPDPYVSADRDTIKSLDATADCLPSVQTDAEHANADPDRARGPIRSRRVRK
jgi:H+/Cl- antiporter ClcA